MIVNQVITKRVYIASQSGQSGIEASVTTGQPRAFESMFATTRPKRGSTAKSAERAIHIL